MSLKLFYSQLNLHSSALHECLKRCFQPCKHAWKHTMIPCIVPYQGRGYNGFGEKIRFWGAWAERQRKKGNPAKSVAFKAGKKPKRQRKKGNAAKFAAFKAGKKPKRQRKRGKSTKSVASPPTSPAPTTLHFQAPHKFPKSL